MTIRRQKNSAALDAQFSISGYAGAEADRIVAAALYCRATDGTKLRAEAKRQASEFASRNRFLSRDQGKARTASHVNRAMTLHMQNLLPTIEAELDKSFNIRVLNACTAAGVPVPVMDVNWTAAAASLAVPSEFLENEVDAADVALARSTGRQMMTELTSFIKNYQA